MAHENRMHAVNSLSQAHTDGKQNRFSHSPSLQALEPIQGSVEAAPDHCLGAKNLVHSIAIRDDMLALAVANRRFLDPV